LSILFYTIYFHLKNIKNRTGFNKTRFDNFYHFIKNGVVKSHSDSILNSHFLFRNMGGHHLILGTLNDFLTGETLEDSHDERYRQKLARLLVENKGYSKDEIKSRCALPVKAGSHRAIIKVDFKIVLSDRTCMIVKYGPGSLVTRQRPVLAASRLLESYQIPIAVVTNGEDADVMDGSSGKVIYSGLEAIPSKTQLLQYVAYTDFAPIPAKRAEMESRIVYAFEIDGACPCDDTLCRLE